MRALRKLRLRVRSLFQSDSLERELSDELRFHVERQIAECQAAGMSVGEARRAALRELGGAAQIKEECRDARSVNFLYDFVQDLRFGARMLRKGPGFAAVAIVTLALGIGATTAVFGLLDRVFFRPLPYADQDRLVSVGMTAPLDTNEFLFAPGYVALRNFPGPFKEVTSFQAGTQACDISEQNPVREKCLRVEWNFLETLGVAPAAGRMFSRDEDVPNGPRVAMISYELWRGRFGSDPGIEGRTLSLDGMPTAITGVLPRDFEIPTLTPADILLPERLNESAAGRALRAFGRLAPGVTISRTRVALVPYFENAARELPAFLRKDLSLSVRSVRDRQVRDSRTATYAIFAAVVALLLIACANLANMLLARGLTRRHEMATRAALGASRMRLLRQALAESVLLGAMGGAAGCGVAWGLLRIFVAIAPVNIPRLAQATLDVRVLAFAAIVSLSAGILAGLAPALRLPRDLSRSGAKATPPLGGALRTGLVTAQIAISLVLLNGAILLLQSLRNIENVPLGILSERVTMVRFELGRLRYSKDAAQIEFFNRLEQRVAALPGIRSFAISDTVPPSGGMQGRPFTTIEVKGREQSAENAGEMVAFRFVTPGYFSTLGIPLVRGRVFEERDRSADAYSVVISNTLAQRLFPGDDAIGKEILHDAHSPWFSVIGVVADVKNNGPQDSAAPEFYLPRKLSPAPGFEGQNTRAGIVIVRAAIAAGSTAAELRDAVAAIDATVPVQIEMMQQRVDGLTRAPRFDVILLGAFAATGTLLAAIGLFGVTAFLVTQGTREIGVRMALGATPRNILRWTLAHAARWVAAGTIFGVAATLGSTRYLRSLLFQVGAIDIRTLIFAVGLLCVVAFIAAIIPARRALQTDPIIALRAE
jgi:predicted permease